LVSTDVKVRIQYHSCWIGWWAQIRFLQLLYISNDSSITIWSEFEDTLQNHFVNSSQKSHLYW
jgi:hypothetical protein